MKSASCLIAFLLACSGMFAQSSLLVDRPAMTPVPCSHYSAELAIQSTSAIVRRPYDVLAYHLEMDWTGVLSRTAATGASREFSALNSIRLRVDSADVSAIELDATSMRIDSVFINFERLSPTPQPVQEKLTLPLASVPIPETLLQVDIYYTHITQPYPNHFDPNNRGFYLYEKGHKVGDGSGDTVEERLAYTLGAPADARYWMPCNDAAYDKATVQYFVHVPDDFVVACTGRPGASIAHGDNTLTYTWNDNTPVSTYLMVVHASKYKQMLDWYHPQDTPNDSIPILHYVWEKDYDGTKYNAKNAFAPVPTMMGYFSERYGPFPFKKYGMAAVQPFVYGGMENQTMVSVQRNWLNGKQENSIAHELSHQWLGDKVTPATWANIWMNEGGATFSEAVWAEHAGQDKYKAVMKEKWNAYMNGNSDGTKQPPCYRTIPYPIELNVIYNYAITYSKGAWVYHMLRRVMGDEHFFPALQKFLEDHANSYAETADMQQSFDQYVTLNAVKLPVTMQTFFAEWVYGQGHPIYSLTSSVKPSGKEYEVNVMIKQTQKTQDVFTMPVTITFTGANSEKDVRTVVNTLREQPESFLLTFVPKTVVIDENDNILCTKSSIITDIEESAPEQQQNLSVYPNPASSNEDIHILFHVERQQQVHIEVLNLLGERLTILQDGLLPPGNYQALWNPQGMAAGTYFVRISSGEKNKIRKVGVMR